MNKIFDSIIKQYTIFPQVEAISLGGSIASNMSDKISDFDIYVFVSADIPVEFRKKIVEKISSLYEIGCEYFGPGDEYFVDDLNIQFDVMFVNMKWFENMLENVWEKHFAANGYTTCFLYTLKYSKILYDKNNWLQNLKLKLESNYPEKLKRNIVRRNLMLLKDKPFASYYDQIKKAIERKDFVSLNHRITAFLASYFDIIFAINEKLHPGEKRLIEYAQQNCKILPENFDSDINLLLIQPNSNTLDILNNLIKNLKKIIE